MMRQALAVLVLLSFSYQHGSAAADKQQLKQHIDHLLTVGWDKTRSGLEEAKQLHEQLRLEAPEDPRVDYAHALVLLKQRRYSQAETVLDEAVRDHPTNLKLARARLWLTVLQRKYNRALVLTEHVAELLPKDDELVNDPIYVDVAASLGRLLGFMAGPAGSKVNMTNLERQKDRVLSVLAPEFCQELEEAFQSVSDRFTELQQQRGRVLEKAKAQQQQRRAQLTADLEQRQKALAERLDALDKESTNVREDLESELEEVQQAEPELIKQLVAGQQRARILRDEVLFLESDIAHLHYLFDRESEGLERSLILHEIRRLNLLQNGLVRDLAAVEASLAPMQAEIFALRNRRVQAGRRFKREADEIASQRNDARKQRQQVDAQQNRIIKRQRNTTPGARSLSLRAKSLMTYEPFPFELERRRLLDSFDH